MKKNNYDSKNCSQFRSASLSNSLQGNLASAKNSNNSNNVAIPGRYKRNNLCDDPTKIPPHILELMRPEQETNKENIPICPDYHVNPAQIPSRLLYIKNFDHLSEKTLIAIFQYYGVIRECTKDADVVLVRYQTLAMADKAKTSIFEECAKINCTISVTYGQIVCTSRIWIGGLFCNISEEEIISELANVQNIINIAWSRNFRGAEVYILYQNSSDAKKSVDGIRQRGCILQASQCPIRVDYTDICSFPFQQNNCQTVSEIVDKCMTQISTKLTIYAHSASVKLHFISGDSSTVEMLLYQEGFQLPVTTLYQASNLNLDKLFHFSNTIFVGIFTPSEEESSNRIKAQLTKNNSVGFSQTTINNETFVSAIFPPHSYPSTYLMTHNFEDFLCNDDRNQSYILVIVMRKPAEILPGELHFNCIS